MLIACPPSFAAGEPVTPVIQSPEHGAENVCMCLRACSRETVTEWGETNDRICFFFFLSQP